MINSKVEVGKKDRRGWSWEWSWERSWERSWEWSWDWSWMGRGEKGLVSSKVLTAFGGV
jgi:hypothetical protein